MNPRRALACWRGVLNPVKNHEQFLELIFALGGSGFNRSYDRLRDAPDGQRLLDGRPDIAAVLTDSDRLARCPTGSLGHAYVDFMQQNRLDAGLYDNTHHDLPAIADRLGWDDDFHYVVHRGIALHDLLHVLGGYGPDVGGEFGVLGLTHGQVGARMTGGSVAMLMVAPLGVCRSGRLRWWRESAARGCDADVLFAAPNEELLDESIDAVRARLGITADEIAHPEGHVYSNFQFGSRRNLQTEQAYEPYRYDPERAEQETNEQHSAWRPRRNLLSSPIRASRIRRRGPSNPQSCRGED